MRNEFLLMISAAERDVHSEICSLGGLNDDQGNVGKFFLEKMATVCYVIETASSVNHQEV